MPPPARLAAASPVDRLSPRTLAGAIDRGRAEHPTVTTAIYNVGVATLQVKVAEGALYPTLTAVGSVQKSYGSTNSLAVIENLSAFLAAQLSVPLYQGGSEYAAIRQAKETLGQRRLDLDTARDNVQATVTQAWGQLDAAKASITMRENCTSSLCGDASAGRRLRARKPASASAPRSTCPTMQTALHEHGNLAGRSHDRAHRRGEAVRHEFEGNFIKRSCACSAAARILCSDPISSGSRQAFALNFERSARVYKDGT